MILTHSIGGTSRTRSPPYPQTNHRICCEKLAAPFGFVRVVRCTFLGGDSSPLGMTTRWSVGSPDSRPGHKNRQPKHVLPQELRPRRHRHDKSTAESVASTRRNQWSSTSSRAREKKTEARERRMLVARGVAAMLAREIGGRDSKSGSRVFWCRQTSSPSRSVWLSL